MSESQRGTAGAPVVSIGLSVFNGEGVLEDAVRSVLAQTRADFELLLCDSGSGDRTAEICRSFAQRDARIRYFRLARNLGLRASLKVALARARGRYFKWMLHEDRLVASYLAKGLALLEERRDVLLCNSIISHVDRRGHALGVLDSGLALADSPSAALRFTWAVTAPHSGLEIHGLGRTEILKGLQHGHFSGAERAFMARLALRGRLAQLPAPLLEMREHPHRLGAPEAEITRALRAELLRIVTGEDLPMHERMRCMGVLAQAWTPGYERVRPTLEQMAALARKAPGLAARSRTALVHLMAQRRRI
jgi:hypothetical protein